CRLEVLLKPDDLVSRGGGRLAAPFRIEVHSAPLDERLRKYVNDGKLRAVFPREPSGPLQDRAAAFSEIDRAHDAAEADGLVTGSILQVGTGPHRAPGVVQHLGRHGAQKKPPEWP